SAIRDHVLPLIEALQHSLGLLRSDPCHNTGAFEELLNAAEIVAAWLNHLAPPSGSFASKNRRLPFFRDAMIPPSLSWRDFQMQVLQAFHKSHRLGRWCR